MKADPDLSKIPVIVVTGQNTPIDRSPSEHIARVQAYITKPISPPELRGAVDMVLGSEPGQQHAGSQLASTIAP